MARSRFNFSLYLTDLVSIYPLGATIASDGGMVPASSPTAKYANVPCAFQPISGDKIVEFKQLNIIASHCVLTNTLFTDLAVGDYWIDQAGLVYDITYFEAEGGALNPVGVVFAIYGKLRMNR